MEPSFTAPQIARLTSGQLEKVRELETKLGPNFVVAYEQLVSPAELTAEQIEELQKVEKELGVCLVAYTMHK